MSLIERIEADRDAARRKGRKEDTAFYSYVISEVRKPGKAGDPHGVSTDPQVVQIVQKLIRQNDETLVDAKGEAEERLRRQNEILNTYLPEQLSENQLTKIILDYIEEHEDPTSKKMLGLVMSMLKDRYAGQYPPALAHEITVRIIESRLRDKHA